MPTADFAVEDVFIISAILSSFSAEIAVMCARVTGLGAHVPLPSSCIQSAILRETD
jgi:hypothetical protein